MLSKSKTNCIVWMNKLDHISIIILFIHEFLINVTSNDDVRWSWNQAKLSKARHFAQIALDFEMQIKLESIAIGNNILVSFRFVLMSTILIAAIILFYLFGCLFQAQINDVGAIWFFFHFFIVWLHLADSIHLMEKTSSSFPSSSTFLPVFRVFASHHIMTVEKPHKCLSVFAILLLIFFFSRIKTYSFVPLNDNNVNVNSCMLSFLLENDFLQFPSYRAIT